MIVVPPWITLSPEQQELYSKLQACRQHFQSENVDDVDDDDNGGGGENPPEDTRRHIGRGGGSGPPRGCKLLIMLRMREISGSSSSACRTGGRYPCDGACSGMVVTPDRLAKVGAW